MVVHAEGLLAFVLLIPIVVGAAAPLVIAVPPWAGWTIFTVWALASYGLLVWWTDRKLNDRLERIGGQHRLAKLEGEKPGARVKSPAPDDADKPSPRDEPLVIVCRRYALPAHGVLSELMADVTNQCFARGGWHGLAAQLLREGVIPSAEAAAGNLEACIDGNRGSLARDLAEFVAAYNRLMAFTYHCGTQDLALHRQNLELWDKLDREFERGLSDLAAGIDRGELAALTRPSEARGLLRGLRAPS